MGRMRGLVPGRGRAGPGRTVRRGRFRPLLVVAACAACLPAALAEGPGGEPDVAMLVVMALLCVVASVLRLYRVRLGPRGREVVGILVIAATTSTLLVLAWRSELPAASWLAIAAPASVTMATIRRAGVRTLLQLILLAGGASLLVDDLGLPSNAQELIGLLVPVALLAAITAVASALATDLERARQQELLTRRAAERRAELLDAVRQLTAAGRGEIVDVTVDALRELGFPVAAVLLAGPQGLVPRRVDGLAPRRDWAGGLSRHALDTATTVVSTDYRNDERRLPGLDLGAVIASPVVADGRAIGVLSVGVHQAGDFPPGDVEVVETLAAHLGGVLANQRIVDNQAALLARLLDLDALRAGVVSRVSEDLRDPLTVVRGIARDLATTADDHRSRVEVDDVLGRLTAQAEDLHGTLEALLDFSRVRVGRGEPRPEPIDLLDLLTPPLAGTGVELHLQGWRPVVVVDPELVQRAIELLRRGSLDLREGLHVGDRGDQAILDVHLRALDGLEGGFARTLAEQLLVAAGARCEPLRDGVRIVLPLAPAPELLA